MNLKQINILISIALFLLFDLLALYLYQTINKQMEFSTQTSQELISSYSVKLNTVGLEQLAQMIKPKENGSKKTVRQPEIALMEPASDNKAEIFLLNGNGIEGHAQTMSAVLEQNGYQVAQITNADRDDYQKTIIYYSEASRDKVLDLQIVLKSFYNEIELIQQVDYKDKIEIVLGQPAQIREGGENTNE